MWEDVTLREFTKRLVALPRSTTRFLVDLSSFPQIDFAFLAAQELERGGYEYGFVGHKPTIILHSLPFIDHPATFVMDGVANYLHYYDNFKYGLRVDEDHHVTAAARPRTVVPLFLSVGCKRACPYCYVSHSNYPQGNLEWDKVVEILDLCVQRGWDIHFTDENFFRHPLHEMVVEYLMGKDVRWLCLTDSMTLSKIIDDKGEDWLLGSGNVCNEVGLETASSAVLSKQQSLESLLAADRLTKYWLTMTFLPHDSIAGLRATGEFLEKHGFEPDELVGGMATNSSVGGLGQFMMMYPGTPYWRDRLEHGVVFSERPTRLWPSFIGHRMLRERLIQSRGFESRDDKWLGMYVSRRVHVGLIEELHDNPSFRDLVVNEVGEPDMRRAVALAQLARLGIVEAVGS